MDSSAPTNLIITLFTVTRVLGVSSCATPIHNNATAGQSCKSFVPPGVVHRKDTKNLSESELENIVVVLPTDGPCLLNCSSKFIRVAVDIPVSMPRPTVVTVEKVNCSSSTFDADKAGDYNPSGLAENTARVAVNVYPADDLATNMKNNLKSASWEGLPINITIKFDLAFDVKYKGREVIDEISRFCVRLNENNRFTSSGCETRIANSTYVECHSTQPGVFTVAFSLDLAVSSYHVLTLFLLGNIISILFLSVTFAVLLYCRRCLQKGRNDIQLNLVVSFLLYQASTAIIVPLYNFAYLSPITCLVASQLSHLLALTSIFAMLSEGVVLSLRLTVVEMRGELRRRHFVGLIVFSWTVPVVLIVGIGSQCLTMEINGEHCEALSSFYHDLYEKLQLEKHSSGEEATVIVESILSNYKKYLTCWPNPISEMRLVLIIPMSIILVINFSITIVVGQIVWRASLAEKNKGRAVRSEANKHITTTLRAVSILGAALGVPWVLSFMLVLLNVDLTGGSIVAHCIINGFQGFIIFVVYCVLNSEVRNIVQRKLNSSCMSNL